MNYGDCLDSAAAGLARSYAALRDPPPDPAHRAAAAMARARLYHALEYQVVALGRVNSRDLPPPGLVPTPGHWPVSHRNPVTALAGELRQASAGTVGAWITGTDPPVADPVSLALRDAYQAIQLAGEILASHTGPDSSPAGVAQPRTSEGMALLAGIGRDHNLAAVARLAAAAADMDVRIVRWLWPEQAPTELRALLAGAEQDAWRTKSGPLRDTAVLVCCRGYLEDAPVLDLIAAPPVDDPLRWAAPATAQDCLAGIDAARSWLLRHGDELSVGQLGAAVRAVLATTRYVGHVYAHTDPAAPPDVDGLAAAAAAPWRDAAQAAIRLRSPVPASGEHTTLTVALTSTARWLQEHLRAEGQWRQPPPWAGDPAAQIAWRSTASELAARLPDLAELLDDAIVRCHTRGGVLAPTGQMIRPAGRLLWVPQWAPAQAQHRGYRALRAALRTASAAGRDFAVAVGAPLRPGLSDARDAQARANTGRSARLVDQWYPAGSRPGGLPPPAEGHQPRRASSVSATRRAPGR